MIELRQGYSSMFLFELKAHAYRWSGKNNKTWELYINLFRVFVKQTGIDKFEFSVPEIESETWIKMKPGEQSVKAIAKWILKRLQTGLKSI